jgi:hypothetical protein
MSDCDFVDALGCQGIVRITHHATGVEREIGGFDVDDVIAIADVIDVDAVPAPEAVIVRPADQDVVAAVAKNFIAERLVVRIEEITNENFVVVGAGDREK